MMSRQRHFAAAKLARPILCSLLVLVLAIIRAKRKLHGGWLVTERYPMAKKAHETICFQFIPYQLHCEVLHILFVLWERFWG